MLSTVRDVYNRAGALAPYQGSYRADALPTYENSPAPFYVMVL
jgi:hypothetical protein